MLRIAAGDDGMDSRRLGRIEPRQTGSARPLGEDDGTARKPRRLSTLPRWVSRETARPATVTTYRSVGPSRFDVNTKRPPSGLQAGSTLAPDGALVSRAADPGAPPSLARKIDALPLRVETYAMRSPCGGPRRMLLNRAAPSGVGRRKALGPGSIDVGRPHARDLRTQREIGYRPAVG